MIQRDDNTLIYMIDAEVSKKAYPVGSVFMTVEDTDPAKLFGGKWEQLTDISNIHVWKRTAIGG